MAWMVKEFLLLLPQQFSQSKSSRPLPCAKSVNAGEGQESTSLPSCLDAQLWRLKWTSSRLELHMCSVSQPELRAVIGDRGSDGP